MGAEVRNVVFMGMGEPLDNLDNLLQAMRVLVDQRGLDIARRYITVSTAGLTAGIDRLARCAAAPVNLAVSLNASNDTVRSQLMPINQAIPMATLRESLMRYPLARKAALFVEYVLIEGVNDQDVHAGELAEYLAPLKAKVNLIACNAAPGSGFNPPSRETFERFQAGLVARQVFVRRRGERGGQIMAACGQLGRGRCGL
jgi:23S rRNA (adenine2503-C2)-methyltransferase